MRRHHCRSFQIFFFMSKRKILFWLSQPSNSLFTIICWFYFLFNQSFHQYWWLITCRLWTPSVHAVRICNTDVGWSELTWTFFHFLLLYMTPLKTFLRILGTLFFLDSHGISLFLEPSSRWNSWTFMNFIFFPQWVKLNFFLICEAKMVKKYLSILWSNDCWIFKPCSCWITCFTGKENWQVFEVTLYGFQTDPKKIEVEKNEQMIMIRKWATELVNPSGDAITSFPKNMKRITSPVHFSSPFLFFLNTGKNF